MGLLKSVKGLASGVKESLGFGGHDKVGNSVGQWMNNFTGSTDMLNKEYANNVALWNMQNDYNTPAAQIARMKAAGIDVNPMTYAVGNGSMSTTASNISAPSVGASGVNPISALMSVLGGIEGIKSQKLQNEMTEKDLEFYTKNGFRPGTNDYFTKLLGIVERFFEGNSGGKGGYSLVKSGSNVRKKGNGDPNKHVIVRDDTKPAVGSNVISVPSSGVKFFPWW